jgi:hypothetical protein
MGQAMTDEDERIINRALSVISNDWQDEREAARSALHRLFRDRRSLENQIEVLTEAAGRADDWLLVIEETLSKARRAIQALGEVA